MNNSEKKVVWILGSGFSKSVGGPLLDDLLSEKGKAQTMARFAKSFGNVHDLFWRHHGKHRKQSTEDPVLWDNAEAFLEVLELATDGINPVAKLFPEGNLKALHAQAVQAVAAECMFDTYASKDLEAWAPYINWASTLTARHTIVTFNYDCVPDRLAAWDGRDAFRFPEPYLGQFALQQGTINVLKLHGSVAWFPRGPAHTDADLTNRLSAGEVPIIATPGRTKSSLVGQMFKKHWATALDAIETANVIVFMGYRFPPSDSQARTEILGAIHKNAQQKLRIHTVLGPRTTEPDTVRLTKLLEHTLHKTRSKTSGLMYTLEIQPLYVEDFLTVVGEEELFGPPW